MKITERKIKQIERRLLKVVKENYPADGHHYCSIDKVEISQIDGYIIDLTIRYGRTDSDNDFQKVAYLSMVDSNVNFIAGQFFEKLIEADGNK